MGTRYTLQGAQVADQPTLLGAVERAVDGTPVWEVQFDTWEHEHHVGGHGHAGGTSSALPAVLACTEGGGLSLVGADGSGQALLQGEYGAVNTFDLESTCGQDVVCCTEGEVLLHVQRAMDM